MTQAPHMAPLNPPARILLAPGPVNVPAPVIQAMVAPMLGHKDPAFVNAMDDIAELLRATFKTQNRVTLTISATGGAGMEAALVNLIEPGDTVVVGVAGEFGQRMAEIVSRTGANLVRLEAELGRAVDPDDVGRALAQHRPKVLALVQSETSTGMAQPMAEIARLAREHDAYVIADTVSSLAGAEVDVDGWGVDVCYSGSQKCLAAPPGLAPITLNDRAMERVRGRKQKVQSWYFDLTILERYWNRERVYHHTAPILMYYALREALRLVHEEGLENRIRRHTRLARGLWAGLEAMGLQLFTPAEVRLPTVCVVRVPDGVGDAAVRNELLNRYNVEIAGGLGPLAGKIWRVGVMGAAATEANLLMLLAALEAALTAQGLKVPRGAGAAAAAAAFKEAVGAA